jgi:DNA-binding transcriptional ArsR family regulator
MPFRSVDANCHAGADLLGAMSNPARLRILCLLVQGEMAVNNLSDRVGLSQSALSQHLAKLRARELVSTRRDAQTIYYKCDNAAVLRVLDGLAEIFAPDAIREQSAG